LGQVPILGAPMSNLVGGAVGAATNVVSSVAAPLDKVVESVPIVGKPVSNVVSGVAGAANNAVNAHPQRCPCQASGDLSEACTPRIGIT
ncbi:hypothetical protein PMAYCL1PPCAC_05680, partial [Pristionchus mayeri]